MGLAEKLEEKLEKTAEKAGEKAKEKGKEKAEDKVQENVVGYVCARVFKSEENQTRCKALSRLSDIASDGKTALASCSTALGAGAAEVGTDGLATPVAGPTGLAAGASCVYSGANVLDSTQAMTRQIITGKETKTLKEEGVDSLGTWIKKKASDEWERQVHEAATSDERHFMEQNPGATHADYMNMQDLEDGFDDGSAFQ